MQKVCDAGSSIGLNFPFMTALHTNLVVASALRRHPDFEDAMAGPASPALLVAHAEACEVAKQGGHSGGKE